MFSGAKKIYCPNYHLCLTYMLKKILILLCFTIISRNVSASEMLQKEITAQLETLYVFQDGLARPLGVTADEVNLSRNHAI